MGRLKQLKIFAVIVFCALCFASMEAQVSLATDFTSNDFKGEPLHNVWSVGNRISPTKGSNLRADLKINLVRMIGGIQQRENGELVKNLDFDPCLYDSITNTYVYRWKPFINRLNKIVESQSDILQIVLDQPPWAFQHGYTFIPEGECDSIHFREDDRMTIYGNALPPADKQAYHDFIKALMTKLIETYGEETVLTWRFRVGSEIETHDHWRGTKQEFIEHFANTEKAVRAILPNAKVGLHTRIPGFLYKKGKVLNYKGQPYASFVDDLIEYCYDNNVKYDFWGISDYVIISNNSHRQMNQKFDELFGDLVKHPKWNSNATLDLMEYSTITSMNALGNGFVNCATSHKEIVELAFTNQFYKNKSKGAEYIYRWGNRLGSEDPVGISVLNTMEGMTHYNYETLGQPIIANNQIEAIFGKCDSTQAYDILVYNFNAHSLEYKEEEKLNIAITSDLPVGTILYCRNMAYGKEQNKLQNFLKNEPESGWIIKGYDRMGNPEKTLNKLGMEAYEKYKNPNPQQFTAWEKVETTERSDGKKGSVINISTSLPSFSFKKYEFRLQAF
ncbi:GH39 family glycosyl hydrolase [Labilibacter marinus]|uniref:GH39 family glycosyl hydrolase n=1 Tax=Labilibacter marinus TaxID=1477105 RepID=UPI00094F6F98|nr:hypothetical protein [Labilibacter marinus]